MITKILNLRIAEKSSGQSSKFFENITLKILYNME